MTSASGERMADAAEVADVGLAHRGIAAVDALADGRWSKTQAMFVDDPRASVAGAASLVDEAVEAFITIMHEQQASLASSWQAQDVGTEELRAAFREYRTFWTSVMGLSQPT